MHFHAVDQHKNEIVLFYQKCTQPKNTWYSLCRSMAMLIHLHWDTILNIFTNSIRQRKQYFFFLLRSKALCPGSTHSPCTLHRWVLWLTNSFGIYWHFIRTKRTTYSLRKGILAVRGWHEWLWKMMDEICGCCFFFPPSMKCNGRYQFVAYIFTTLP